MSCSASSTRQTRIRRTRHGRLDRAIARGLVAAIALINPLAVFAGEEWQDPNNTSYDTAVVHVDNSLAGQTNITIDVDRTTIDWQDFQQPESNTLDFNFSNPNDNSSVLNRIGSQSATNIFGSITSNGQVILANPFGVFIREGAVLDVGSLVAVGANVSRLDFMNSRTMTLPLTGDIDNAGMIFAEGNIALLGRNITNSGTIRSNTGSVLAIAGQNLTIHDWDALTADFLYKKNFFGFLQDSKIVNTGTISAQNAAFFGGQITNMGDIEIQDGTLLMIAADAVWVTEFDNPVLIKVPNQTVPASRTNDSTNGEVEYAIENYGRLDAGLGHVRLAASDPLGYAIRQGAGTAEAPAVIVAQKISLEGGKTGRVHLSGEVDASDLSGKGVGGEIDITGSMVVLEGANIHASGTAGGGRIRVGGEREGRGELQRARLALVDADSEIHADAIRTGNGGEVIVFAEDLTSVDGEITARGGANGGNGGFVETSGLRNFLISRAPNVTAASGRAGEWLIDPFNITIDDTAPSADTNLNNSINAILSPSFDSAGFDGILRTVRESSMDANGNVANLVSADLIADALATGTSVTLSTQAFGIDRGTEDPGDINILSDILVDSLDTIEGTTATLRLLAAGDINVESDIMAFLTLGDPTNLTLNVELHANDAGQIETDQRFDATLLDGDVLITADIRTGGGNVVISGSSVIQAPGQVIETDGGNVDIRSGTVNQFGIPVAFGRRSSDPALDATATPDPRIEIAGDIDTCVTASCLGSEPGGDVTLVASSITVRTDQGGADPEQIVSGLLLVTGQIETGGGDIALSGGARAAFSDSSFTGNVDIDGTLNSGGGNITIVAIHKDPNLDTSTVDFSFLKDPLEAGGFVEGGFVDIDANITTAGGTLSIGGELTRSIQLDGAFDTTRILDTTENGLIQLIAQDLGGVDTADGIYGQGEIILGATSATSISTSALVIESRVVQFSEGAGANAVTLVASGSSTATLPELSSQTEAITTTLTRGSIRIAGERQITFNQNTSVTAESIEIVAAARPEDLNTSGASGDERINSETRLVFGGAGGSDPTVGVRLNADAIQISVGDGTTPSSDGFLEDLGTSAAPTEFGLQRLTRASYDGLQLRSTASAQLPAVSQVSPSDVRISQDGDLTLLSTAPTAPAGELDLVGAFDSAAIGADGIHLTLESSDGLLTVEDAIGLNNDAGVMPDSDAGRSFVVLNGGLVLTTSPNEPTFMEDSVRFRDGTAILGADGTTAFDVSSLTVSSAGSFTVRQQIIDSIDPVNLPNELVFEAGRNTGASDAAGRGTLTIDPGLTIQSGERLALLAGGSGFGNLVFAGVGTTLAADDIALRAGAGVDSQNLITSDRSSITGLQANGVMIRDARFAALGNAAVFGEGASSATSFSYRQDAAIDAQTDLPELTQFGLPATGFRTAGDIAYKVRSDEGSIDLDDEVAGTNEGDRFQNTALSLIGVDSTSNPAIDVSSDFSFVGNRIELGGIGDFTFTQTLAAAFNRSGTVAEEEITLRAGAGGIGNLDFNRGTQSSVIVRAPRVNLIAGDGAQVDDNNVLIGQSSIDTRNAQFDLGGPVGSTPTFSFSTVSIFSLADLPDVSQFMTDDGMGSLVQLLPDILAIRNELGEIDLEGFDISLLPLDVVDDAGRLILEAETIRLARLDGSDLNLTSFYPNLKLRLRTNNLTLIAANADVEFAGNGKVLIGPQQPGDNLQPDMAMADSTFDNQSLLIEAFDRDARAPTVANLSSMSEDSPGSDLFTLADGRGPTTITIVQDAPITPTNLFERDAVAGQFTRSFEDDLDGAEIATIYSLASVLGSVTFSPENVNGSNLLAVGTENVASVSAINFGIPGTPGVFFFDNVLASTESSIIIQDGTEITATDSISLAAGQLLLAVDNPGDVFGSILFEIGGATTRLTANKISLTAGPAFKLEGPDDPSGDPTPIDDGDLPRVSLLGLDEIVQTGDVEGSFLSLTQSKSLEFVRGSESDFLTPIEAGMSANRWGTLSLSVTQSDLTLTEIDSIAAVAESLIARTVDLESKIEITVPDGTDPMVPVSPFDTFVGIVEFQSNDILFKTTNVNTSIDLGTDKLSLISTTTLPILAPANEVARLRGDPDIDNRPIVRIEQFVDFTDSTLPQPSQYSVIDGFGLRTTRSDLSRLDIELTTTDIAGTLTLDDDIRARVTTANLILDSAGDIEFSLTGPTPGFSGLDYADLQLSSLDMTAAGNITIRPFTSGGNPANLTIETVGDQRFSGAVMLENTLSTRGRDIRFTGNIEEASPADTAGLLVASSGKVVFERNIGTVANPLDRLTVTFDSETDEGTPNVEFDFDTTAQSVNVENDIIFLAYDFDEGDRTTEIETALGTATTLPELDIALAGLGIGRTRSATVATIGKNSGDLTFTSANGNFVMAEGEKLSVGGAASINVQGGLVALGDVSAITLAVTASAVGLVRRASGSALSRSGEVRSDGGASIIANTIAFMDTAMMALTPIQIGSGRSFRFGVPNPFDPSSFPASLDQFPLFEINADGSSLTVEDFSFLATSGDLLNQVPIVTPGGASRSDLSDAFPPEVEPVPSPPLPELVESLDPDRLMELDVYAHETPIEVRLARLEGAAIINDLDRSDDDDDNSAAVTTARIDAQDAEAAIALYEELFGKQGNRAGNIRSVLQNALDRYLENSRARRVVGFELRRFVKNRPSTLFEAYTTLESLDDLFQYHRRLGLSPGEYRGIQKNWLRQIQPDGITLDELSEAIHPSRYVRGSDILDIFGR